MGDLPGAVLFACNYNRVRSPIAVALLRRLFGDRVFVDSCGLRPDDEDEPDPFVVTVMDELGLDMTTHKPKTFDELEDENFDLIVSLTPQAQHRAVELTRNGGEIEYWPTADPTLAEGSREAVLQAYRATRDELDARIRRRFGAPATFGG